MPAAIPPTQARIDYACDYCQDVHFVRFDVPVGDPRFGKISPCSKCNQAAITYNSGLQPHERKITLSSLESTDRPDALKMKSAAAKFINSPVGFLSFFGGYGNGKTVALMAIVNECIARGIEARYLTAHQLMDWLYEAFDEKVMETDRGRIIKLARLPVLVIDEFDKARETAYAADMQQHLIDERYRNAHELGTVFAWNGDAGTIPWGAVASRMREFPMIENRDADMRPAIGKAK